MPHKDDQRMFRRGTSRESTYDDVHQYMEYITKTVPDGGQAKSKRQSLTRDTQAPAARGNRPIPGGGRPKPTVPKNKPVLPKARALYPYAKGDINEIDLEADEIIVIDLEDTSGWWVGVKANGQKGFFPGSYVVKI